MRKSRISFSISKKSGKSEETAPQPGGAAIPTEAVPVSTKEPTLKPSSYYACRFCCKRFKSEKGYETHKKTKSHGKAVEIGSVSEQNKSRSCTGCNQTFETRLQLTEHCKRFSHVPLVQKTALRNPEYGKAYTVEEQEDPFVSIKYYSPYYCEVCDLDCVSDVHYKDHVKGVRHQKALEKRAEQGSGLLLDLDNNEVDVTDQCLVIMNKIEAVTESTVSAYYCGICDTDCRSELAYTEHVTSKEHQVRMEGHGQIKISCDLCCMTFTNANNYKMHLKSKKHASNEAARQRLLPLEAQTDAAKAESVQDLRDKIKRTLSPPRESFDKIKVNVASVPLEESAVRSVTITDDEIEADEEAFKGMGKPNSRNSERKADSASKDKNAAASSEKSKEDELERDKWAKKKEEDYARRKAASEKLQEKLKNSSTKWDPSAKRGALTPRGRGRGRGGRGRGRGAGRFVPFDEKFSWVNPAFDVNGKKIGDKEEGRRDRDDRRSDRRSDKRDRDGDKRDRDGDKRDRDGDKRDRDGDKRDRDGDKRDRDGDKRDRDGDKRDRDGDKRDKRESDKRDSKSERRGRSREKDTKKRDSDSGDEYNERVILKRGERKRESSSSEDEGDLRKVINKQRDKSSKELKTARDSDDEYEVKTLETLTATAGENKSSLVFDYGHKHVERREPVTEKSSDRTDLKGFFGGALSGYFQGEAEYGPHKVPAGEPQYGEQRPVVDTPPEERFERAPSVESGSQKGLTTEKALLLELLKRQFPDIRYLTEQQGGLELMQRIFGEHAASALTGGVSGMGSDGAGGGGGGRRRVMGGDVGKTDSRGVVGVGIGADLFGPMLPTGLSSSSTKGFGGGGGGEVSDDGGDIRVVSEDHGKTYIEVTKAQKSVKQETTSVKESKEKENKEKESKESRRQSPDTREVRSRKPDKGGESDKSDSRRERRKRSRSRSRSRSRDRRRRSRSRSGSRDRSKYRSRYSGSRKRSRSSSLDRSSSKRSKRTPSPSRDYKKEDAKSTKRRRSVSPKREKKTETSTDTSSHEQKRDNELSQAKAKSKEAKEKAISKWTVSNWSGKERSGKPADDDEKAEEVDDKKSSKDDKKVRSKVNEKERSSKASTDPIEKEGSSRRRGSIEKSETKRKDDKIFVEDEGKIFEDASDYEDIAVDDIMDEDTDRDLKKQFERDYDDVRSDDRRERVDDRRQRPDRRERIDEHREGLERLAGRAVPRIDDVRMTIPVAGSVPEEADEGYDDPYSYEERAFRAQEARNEPPMSIELLTQMALHLERLGTGPPYPPAVDFFSTPAGMAFARQSMAPGIDQRAGQGLGASQIPTTTGLRGSAGTANLGLPGQTGLGPGTGVGLASEQGTGRGTGAGRGTNVYTRGGISGGRSNSALMYIQPTEEPVVPSRPPQVTPIERLTSQTARLPATSQASVPRSSSDWDVPISSAAALRAISSLLATTSPAQGTISHVPRTISPVQRTISPVQRTISPVPPEASTKRGPGSSDDDLMSEEIFTRATDSDQHSSEPQTKPLKSILKKQSKFSAVEARTGQDTGVGLTSGNLPPKSAVGAEYVVQNPSSTEQGKFVCQLCDVQFATLSAKNLHLRGPNHLAMFMKQKTPLIEGLIEQAMGGTGTSPVPEAKEKEDDNEKESSETDNLEDREQTKSKESYPASHRVDPILREKRSREADLEEALPRGFASTEAAYAKRSREGEPRLFIDEKTGRFVQAEGYYSDDLKDDVTADRYDERRYSQATATRVRDDRERGRGTLDVSSKDDYSPSSRDDYDQYVRRESIFKDEYERLAAADRGYPISTYDVRREEALSRHEYGRPPPRDTLAPSDDYGRVPASRTDYEYARRVAETYRSGDARGIRPDDYDRASRDRYPDDSDWRRIENTAPYARERPGEQPRDWSRGESRPTVTETTPAAERKPDPYSAPTATANNPSSAPTGTRDTIPQEQRSSVYAKATGEQETRESTETRRETAPVGYASDYNSRRQSADSRDASDDVYGKQQSYRDKYDRDYSHGRFPGGRDATTSYDREGRNDHGREHQGYGYDAARRGRGARGRGGPSMGGRGGSRGYTRKPGFSRPPQRGWKGGQGRY